MQKIGRLTVPKKMAQSLHSGTDECEPTSHAVIKKENTIQDYVNKNIACKTQEVILML